MIKTYMIKRVKDQKISEIEDSVAEESPLTIYINGEELVTMVCTPDKQDLLAIGFLKSEGIIEKRDDIKNCNLDLETQRIWIEVRDERYDKRNLEKKRLVTSGCARGISFFTYDDALKSMEISKKREVPVERALKLMREFQHKSELFNKTGGVHSAALADEERILLFAEDLGRHNAVDKIIGEALVKGIDISDKILLSSGRISSEVILKAGRNGIPVVISRSAPTSIAVNIARELNMTLIGFARGTRANIYS